MNSGKNEVAEAPHIVLLLLRLIGGGSLLYFHAWPSVVAAYKAIWEETPWEIVPLFEAASIPNALIVASAGAAIAFLCAIGVVFGAVTRLASIALAIISVCSLYIATQSGLTPRIELSLLYFAIFGATLLKGAGMISFDGIFSAKKEG